MVWDDQAVCKLVQMYSDGYSVKEIAESLKITVGSVKNKAYRLRITKPRCYSDDEKEYILSNYKSYNLQEIADNLGRPKSNICRFIRECGIERTAKKKEYAPSMQHERLYGIWKGIIRRCTNANDIGWKNYGARGICVCDNWRNDFESFKNWALSNGYSNSLSIDRIDVNGNYCPENCRWANKKDQANNTRVNHRITFKGITHTIAEWAAETGMSDELILWRINNGMTVEEALTRPVRKLNRISRESKLRSKKAIKKDTTTKRGNRNA